MPAVTFRSIRVDTSSDDEVGRLILSDGRLVGVLVRLDGEEHGPLKGSWFLEAGFGPMSSAKPEPFKDLSETQLWVERILGPDGKEIVSAAI